MDSEDLTTPQADKLYTTVFPHVNHLLRLKRRMEDLRFPTTISWTWRWPWPTTRFGACASGSMGFRGGSVRRSSQRRDDMIPPAVGRGCSTAGGTLDELGMADATPLGEILLTLAGYYVGREFRFADVRAVWMASQGQIKFYADDGAVLRVVEVGEPHRVNVA